MTNNATSHNTYGMGGSYFAYGSGILANFYPGHTFSSNYLGGASASRYPAGTLVAGDFDGQFTNPSGGDFSVRAGSILRNAATDGLDIGAPVGALAAMAAAVTFGSPANSDDTPPASSVRAPGRPNGLRVIR
jgi:hypothetical protein